MAESADRTFARPGRRGLAAACAVAALVAVGAVSFAAVLPPAAAGVGAPADAFSAHRAFTHVTRIGDGPHDAGSAANDRVRDDLVGTLGSLGLQVEVQDTVAAEGGALSASAGVAGLARVRNIVGVLPGTASTGRLFLVAHYDSVQTGPGGNDDGAGVGTVLETARALTAGPRPRNDVVFLLTDAEEACLCGAAGFVRQHPLARDGGVVLNIEARGSTGPAVMFETSARNAALIDAYAAVPHPVGTSFAVEVYRALPNDTDFTPFREAGFAGLNSAYIDGAAVYHTPLDTPDRMDRRSLQHHGDNALALARELGGTDLPALRADGDATYFPTPVGLVRYPGSWTWPLAVLALLAVVALTWLARRRGRTTWPRVAAATLSALLPLAVAAVLAQLLTAALLLVRPGFATMVDPYRPGFFRLAVLALAAAVVTGWYALLRRRVGPAAMALGGLLWLAALGVALAAAAPGGSYLTALPALAGAAAGAAALALRGRWAVVALTAGAAVAVVVLLPTALLIFPALGLRTAGAGALVAVLFGLAALPIVDLLHPEAGGARGPAAGRARRRAALPAAVATLTAVATVAAGLAANPVDAAHPAPTHLMYALDADTGQARWYTDEDDPQDWTARYTPDAPRPPDGFVVLGEEPLHSGPAPAAPLPAPTVTVTGSSPAAGSRTVRLRITPQRTVRLLALAAPAATVTRAVVAGRDVDIRDRFAAVLHAPPADGVEIVLEVPGTGPVPLRVIDASTGLGGLPGFVPRPPGVGIAGSHSAEMVMVGRTYPV
jgi:hypothetical protein